MDFKKLWPFKPRVKEKVDVGKTKMFATLKDSSEELDLGCVTGHAFYCDMRYSRGVTMFSSEYCAEKWLKTQKTWLQVEKGVFIPRESVKSIKFVTEPHIVEV